MALSDFVNTAKYYLNTRNRAATLGHAFHIGLFAGSIVVFSLMGDTLANV
jgi:hypothetical protein